MKTWEEAQVMELNINETATDATETAESSVYWGWGSNGRPNNGGSGSSGRPNNGGSCSGGSGSVDSSFGGNVSGEDDMLIDALS